MKMAREHGPGGFRPGRPEDPCYEVRPQASARQRALRLRLLAAVALAGSAGIGAGIRGANR